MLTIYLFVLVISLGGVVTCAKCCSIEEEGGTPSGTLDGSTSNVTGILVGLLCGSQVVVKKTRISTFSKFTKLKNSRILCKSCESGHPHKACTVPQELSRPLCKISIHTTNSWREESTTTEATQDGM